MPLAEAAARVAVPLAGLAAMAALAAHEVDPMAAAESGYLAVVATAVLAAVALLAPAPAPELGLGAALATAAVWVLPEGPGRGAAVLFLLVATLAVAAGRRLVRCPPDRPLPLAVTVPLAVGLQALLRGDLLLAPRRESRTFLLLLVLPVAGALATSLLSRRHGRRAAVALGLSLAVTPGFTVASTLALVALTGGDALAATAADAGSGPGAWRPRLFPGPVPGALRALGAILAMLLPFAWGPPAQGLLAAAAGLALARPALGLLVAAALDATWIAFQLMGSPQVVPVVSFSDPSLHGPAVPFTVIAWLLVAVLLVPAALRPAADRRRWLLAGGLLALAARGLAPGVAFVRDPSIAALAAPLALLAFAVDEDRAAAVLQRVWTAALLAGTALFASYPWLRARPLDEARGLLGTLVATAIVAAALAYGVDRWSARRRARADAPLDRWQLPVYVALAALFLGIALHLPPPSTPILATGGALRLSAGSPVWEAEVPGQRLSGVSIDSALENGAAVAAGTRIATVHLVDDRGDPRRDVHFGLDAGRDTAEWAARRPDVAGVLAARGESPPPAWLSWVAGDFFGQRYRRVVLVPIRRSRVRIELAPGLPPDLALALYRVEILR
jgi:hypothetical protein